VSAGRIFDLVVATAVLIVASPAMLAAAVAVRLDSPGPILFRQLRVGRHGRTFRILKFRTMRHAASGAESGLSVGDEPDVTRIGRLLRQYKLNELPQLFNVLRGEMSIVGPRPELPGYVALYKPRDRAAILAVRPGITDPASLLYRRESDLLAREVDPQRAYVERIMPRKLAIARRYLRRRTLLSDLGVILVTAYAILRPARVPLAESAASLSSRPASVRPHRNTAGLAA